MFVKRVNVSKINNSRGERTVLVKLTTFEGTFMGSAPSGKSTGKREVKAWNKHGFPKSLTLARKLGRILIGKNFLIKRIKDMDKIEQLFLKFEKHFGKLGGDVWFAFESAFVKAAAKDLMVEPWQLIHDSINPGKKPKIPMPVGNTIGGGLHSKKIKNKRPDFQEFLLIPSEKTFSRAITKNIHAYNYARNLLKTKLKNDESAWRTSKTNEEVLEILRKTADKYGLRIGLDIAANSFFKENYYEYQNKRLTRDRLDQIDYVTRLIKKFKIFYCEDPMNEEDFAGFKQIRESLPQSYKTLIVGDDLTTTNPKQLARAIKSKSINSIIIKPNQIGSIVETAKTVELAKKHNIKIIFSHRSGETMDTILADYAVGFGADFLKCGVMGPQRLVKHKRIIDIERSLR